MEPVYATMHFYYNDEDSMSRYRACNQALDVRAALREFDNALRSIEKYGGDEKQIIPVTKVRAMLYGELKYYGINLDED
jgi:hypothetical protein